MKILTAETDLTSATNISKAPVARVYNSDSSAITLTRKSNAGTTIGSYSVPPSKVIYCQKFYTDTLAGGAALKATGVGYSEELDIICLGNCGGSSIVDTDLYIHYDFSSTDCWNRTNGTNTDDYTIHNLANDYNDGLLRSRTDSGNDYRNASDSPVIDFNSSDGGGCLEFIPSNISSTSDNCAIVIPGSNSHTHGSIPYYNITTVSSTDTNNLYKGIGTGAYTWEFWFKVYLDNSLSGSNWFMYSYANSVVIHRMFYYHGNYSSYGNKIRILPGGFSSSVGIDIIGAPSSGAAWSDWNHLVYSRNSDAANDTKIYLNNSLEATTTDDKTLNYLEYWYNRYVSTSTPPTRRGIIRFYRGKALTASEVTQNWDAQKSRFGY